MAALIAMVLEAVGTCIIGKHSKSTSPGFPRSSREDVFPKVPIVPDCEHLLEQDEGDGQGSVEEGAEHLGREEIFYQKVQMEHLGREVQSFLTP